MVTAVRDGRQYVVVRELGAYVPECVCASTTGLSLNVAAGILMKFGEVRLPVTSQRAVIPTSRRRGQSGESMTTQPAPSSSIKKLAVSGIEKKIVERQRNAKKREAG